MHTHTHARMHAIKHSCTRTHACMHAQRGTHCALLVSLILLATIEERLTLHCGVDADAMGHVPTTCDHQAMDETTGMYARKGTSKSA